MTSPILHTHNIEVWRDTPKPLETDAQWCALSSINGHVIRITTGHATPEAARQAIQAQP